VQRTPRDPRIGLVLVGFSPPERLAPIARHLGWDGLVLGDPGLVLYHRLRIGRAPWWRVYSPGTLRQYARHPRRITRPARAEDTRQLGGDAVTRDAAVVALWRPRSPNDRPAAADVIHQATLELTQD
jgi:hypothetical protein